MEEAVATVREPVPDYRLIARNPAELEASRRSLVKFFDAKLVQLDEEFAAVEANLEIALKFPIKTQPLRTQLNRIAKRQLFYSKAKAAVEAGFHIIPNFDADVFAIRTKRDASGHGAATTWGHDSALRGMPVQKAQALPVGDGRYVSPRPRGHVESWTEKAKDGSEITKHFATVSEFDDIDFPFLFARPEVLTAAQQLMADKIFDELGALPRTQRNADPMVVGIIKESSERNAKRLTFLVVWFLDTNTL